MNQVAILTGKKGAGLRKQSFFQGTLILIGAGILTRLLGFIPRIALPRIIGAEGVGLYTMAAPTLYLMITLATFGLNVAVSKVVAEAEARRDIARMQNTLRLSLAFVLVLSLAMMGLMIGLAPLISRYLLTDPRSYYPLVGIAPILPIVAVSSVLRGYFQGRQNMVPTAMSSIAEAAFRIVAVLGLAWTFQPYGVAYAAMGAMIGVVVGEFGSLCVLLLYVRRSLWHERFAWWNHTAKTMRRSWTLASDLSRVAVPVTASRLVGNAMYFIEPIAVTQSLAIAGIGTTVATSLYGQLEGMAIPLLLMPTAITYSLSVSLVPAISEAAAQGNYSLINRRLYQALRLSIVIGGPCAVLLYVLARPLCDLLWRAPEVGRLLEIMAPFSLFLYVQGPLSAALQGLDRAREAMRNSIIGAVVKTAAIFAFATQPRLGIDGVAIAINIGMVLVTLLHLSSLARTLSLTLALRDYGKTGLALLLMGYIARYAYDAWFAGLSLGGRVFATGALALLVYTVLLVWLRVLGRQDIQRIPWIGDVLAPYFPKR
ncbi:stage V sporulation protein B [Calditerricola satsumensis]|uniref:stage V sporulation protein B n=2 Tax=Calditerricola satsumensis TaxID=373054 RepID=UPI001E59FBF9|nr:stage V sporulation protein B [Calditerricola satsumensis]